MSLALKHYFAWIFNWKQKINFEKKISPTLLAF